MQVTFEKDSLSTAHYVELPAQVRLKEVSCPVARWSLLGFFIPSNTPELDFIEDELLDIEFVVPLATHEAVLRVACQFVRETAMEWQFRFADLSPIHKKLLRESFELSIHGAVPGAEAQYDLVPAPAPAQMRRAKGQLRRTVVAYGLTLAVVAILGWWLWREVFYVYSLRGSVMGDFVQYRAPDANYLATLHVHDGDEVHPGQPLYTLRHDAYSAELKQRQRERDCAQNELALAEASVRQEEARSALLVRAAGEKLAFLESQRTAMLKQLQTARALYNRSKALIDRRAASVEELQVQAASVDQLSFALEQTDRQIVFQKHLTEEAKANRFLCISDSVQMSGPTSTQQGIGRGVFNSGLSFNVHDIQGNLSNLQENVARKRAQVEGVSTQIVQLESQLSRCQVLSTVAGRVNHVNRRAGDFLTTGDYVLSIQEEAGQTFVACRFTADDARFLKHGSECRIVSVARGLVTLGRVTSIGRSGLSDHGVSSADDETVLDQVVVKFELPPDCELRGGEGVFVKVPRSWSLGTWLEKLR